MTNFDLIRLKSIIDLVINHSHKMFSMTDELRDSLPESWRRFPKAVALGDFVIIPRDHFERNCCPYCFADEPDGQMCHCMNDE